jgi:large subunit ribosomal protein L23
VRKKAPAAAGKARARKATRAKKGKKFSGPPVLVGPIISEKATQLSAQRCYVFAVRPGASKKAIAQAVAQHYGVRVEKVRKVKLPRKPRRRGFWRGYAPARTRAYVTLAEGDSIDVAP